jgi:hypothetical protein
VPDARPALAELTLLTAVITHLPAAAVDEQMAYLAALAPDARFVVCHGGDRAEFDRVAFEPALFVDDPSLRGHIDDQSYDAILRAVHERFVRHDGSVDLVYVIEYDHLILRADFEQQLRDAARRSGAGFIAKNCVRRNDTNWFHYHRCKHDTALNSYFADVSVRDDPDARYGCLGSGMLITREALAAFAGLPTPPPAYLELFIPTAMYHLGVQVDDFDRLGELYAAVRWRPEFAVEEARTAMSDGRAFVHPFKRLDALATLRS